MAGRDPCCDTFVGGFFHLQIGDRKYSVAGEARIRPGYVERNTGAASDGRMWATETPQLSEADLIFYNFCDADPLEVFAGRCKIDATFVEETRGFRHYFNQAVAAGRPEINMSNGQVTNISIRTDKYSRAEGTGPGLVQVGAR
jgi:hypothetical protein